MVNSVVLVGKVKAQPVATISNEGIHRTTIVLAVDRPRGEDPDVFLLRFVDRPAEDAAGLRVGALIGIQGKIDGTKEGEIAIRCNTLRHLGKPAGNASVRHRDGAAPILP